MTTLLDQVPHQVLILPQQICHVNLFSLVARERHIQLGQSAALLIRGQLLRVQEVLGPLAAAVVQQAFADLAALLAVVVALLDEAAEGREAGARPDHEHRGLELEGQAELGAAHEYGHARLQRVCWQLVLEPVGAHAVAGAAVLGLVLDDCACYVNRVRIDLNFRFEFRLHINFEINILCL